MADENPIIDGAIKIRNKINNFFDSIPPTKKPDTSWHDEMVSKAQAIAQEDARREAEKKKATPKKPVARKRG